MGVAPDKWTITHWGNHSGNALGNLRNQSVRDGQHDHMGIGQGPGGFRWVVQGQPRASPRGRAEASVRLTTWRMSWPARFQTGANSRETWPAPMSTMRSSATA